MSSSRPLVTIVTGARWPKSTRLVLMGKQSRGIGSAIVEKVATGSTPTKIYAVSRAGRDLGIQPKPPSSIVYRKLDISSTSDIKRFADEVKQQDGACDRLINNAGTNVEHEKGMSREDKAQRSIDVNYTGTKEMCNAFLPLMRDGGRIVSLSSIASHLRGYSSANADRFKHCSSIEDVDSIADSYLEASRSARGEGWASPYCVSKALINALTAVLARQNPKLDITCCCPGWVDTDMGGIVGKPPKTLEEGARIPVRLAFGDVSNCSGKFVEEPSIHSTGEGRVSDWFS